MSAKTRFLAGNDAMSMMIDIYADGMMAGAGSILATFQGAVPENVRDRFVNEFVTDALGDPAIREVIRQEIAERLTGCDSGPKNLHLPPRNTSRGDES